MIKIDVRGIDGVKRLLDQGGKQARFAAAVALTRTAKRVQTTLQRAISTALPGASPYTARATFATSANKSTLTALVGIKDQKPARGTAPAVLLKEHFTGGVRGNKPMEKALTALGVLPTGWRVVPGAGMPLDRYGNPRAKIIGEIIGALKSRMQIVKGRGKNAALVGYFVIVPGARSHLAPGVYWRKGRAVRPMLLYIKSAGYRRLIDLPTLAARVVNAEFSAQFATAYAQAMSSAR